MPMMNKWVNAPARFFREDIWQIQMDNSKRIRAAAIRFLRVLTYAVWGFQRNECHLRASALTFYSLLSFVPLVAMAFAVAKGFGFRKLLEKAMLGKFPGHEAVLHQVIISADSFLESTKGGLIAGVGVVILFWTIIKVLGQIEKSFNNIWQVKTTRSIGRKFSDYISMMIFCPLLFIVSSSFAIFITTEIRSITDRISLLGMLAPVIFLSVDYFPYLIIWALFTFLYMFMPNTRVRFLSALPAGMLSGTIFQMVQYLYLHFQFGVAQYNAIYGSFAALPLFFVWMQISWLIVLFGAEFSFALQTAHANKLLPPDVQWSATHQRLIALRIVHLIIKRFQNGEAPLQIGNISSLLGFSPTITEKIISLLCNSGLISAVKVNGMEEPGYQPGLDISGITILQVIEAMDQQGDTHPTEPLPDPESKLLAQALANFNEIIRSAPSNLCLKDI
ncbi:MAG: YhjD/YihY/BrkB family envelope integrity protein [Desulfobacterales bacterium]|jgi:membrane protein|nr:YhjD/YihY/BrkB family envelope integrity protein [Desulfobacterales bacterium]